VDAVLRGITVVNAAGDGGSGGEYPNGLTNVEITHASAYTLTAGGASLSTVHTAGDDKTLSKIFAKAMDGDLATIWGGGYFNNESGAGGVDTSQPTPNYQIDFGLLPVTPDPRAASGRGIPDVAATSGGNMAYKVPWPDFEPQGGSETTNTGGTSAAAPLWAALTLQINAVFADQKLPRLGYMNDLLYTAAVIAPAAFNDVSIGDNMSSFVLGGSYFTAPKEGTDPTITISPTGYGYAAGQGYDLATGLGTPNGVLLARAMTWIAHDQFYFADHKKVLRDADDGHWRSTSKQDLLFQVTATDEADVNVRTGTAKVEFDSPQTDRFAWTSQFAQQTLQRDFDPALIALFDGQSQGALIQKIAKKGQDVSVKIDGDLTTTPQAKLSSPYGFADYVSPSDVDSSVRVARPVAVAETVGGADDQVAVLRMRQAGHGELSVKFYRVDDFKGTIKGIKPGSEGYNAAANARAYETKGGKTKIEGPGYGEYRERKIVDIDAGDIVAMKLKKGDHVYFAFAKGNEMLAGEHVGHLWNYGVNTWGWESGFKGADHDYNDLVVQIDFTSAYGNGWLI
jgi:hypothetical protein